MDDESSGCILKSLAVYVQSLCSQKIKFKKVIQITGHLVVSVDHSHSSDYFLNEHIFRKELEEDVTFESNSHVENYKIKQEKDSAIKSVLMGGTTPLQGGNSPFKVNVSLPFQDKKMNLDNDVHLRESDKELIDSLVQTSKRRRRKKVDEDFISFDITKRPKIKTILKERDQTIKKKVENIHKKQPGLIKKIDKTFKRKGCFKCDQCNSSFKYRKNIEKHLAAHFINHPSKPKQNKNFSNADKKGHKFSCNECDKSFAREKGLMTHMKFHQDIKRYMCELCGKSFNWLTSYRMHKLRHLGKKLWSCKICNHRFYEKGRMETHMRTHTGERPYTCEQCGMCFKQSHTLKEHTRIHSGEKPHSCEKCSKSFTQRSTLLRHMKTHNTVLDKTTESSFKTQDLQEPSTKVKSYTVLAKTTENSFKTHDTEEPLTKILTKINSTSVLHNTTDLQCTIPQQSKVQTVSPKIKILKVDSLLNPNVPIETIAIDVDGCSCVASEPVTLSHEQWAAEGHSNVVDLGHSNAMDAVHASDCNLKEQTMECIDPNGAITYIQLIYPKTDT